MVLRVRTRCPPLVLVYSSNCCSAGNNAARLLVNSRSTGLGAKWLAWCCAYGPGVHHSFWCTPATAVVQATTLRGSFVILRSTGLGAKSLACCAYERFDVLHQLL